MSRLALALALLLAAPALAQGPESSGPVPDRRVAISRDVDLPGGDRASYFDTTLDACEAACLADGSCAAFTYNSRSGACFVKESVGPAVPYQGAVSGIVTRTPAAVLAAAPARAAELDFLQPSDLQAAADLARRIGRLHASDGVTAAELLDSAAAGGRAGDPLGALRFTGAALAAGDGDGAGAWLDYARLARTVAAAEGDEAEAARERALPAAVNAYLRADAPGLRATVLSELARILEVQGRGRDTIPALRLSLETEPRPETEAARDRALGLFGFRVVDTQVESDAAEPRVCAIFNEDLVQAGVDYDTYVQLPSPSLTVTVDGAQLCVEGVDHGARYRFALREGLPAATDEILPRSLDLNIYVRDRSPAARFPTRAFILPRTADPALPIETVNLRALDLTLYRVAERQIVRTVEDGLFRDPLYAWQQDLFADEVGVEVWTGSATVPEELNRDVLTRLPMAEALAGRPAGLYVLTAAIPDTDPYDSPPATQWFILSDLGLSTWDGSDGMTVAVRSLASAQPLEGVEVALVSAGNAVLDTQATDTSGRVRFAPGLTRGTGAAQPAMVTAVRWAHLGFLPLTDPAFDLSDRGVEGREPAGPIDVFLAPDRGAYRAGETVHLMALMRDAEALAVEGVPLTAVLIRPDGVEYSRIASLQDRAGGHVFALPVAANAPRGTWRIEVLADTDAPPLATARILVEDFLPERIDVELAAGPLPGLGQPARLDIGARYLFGPPAGDLAVEGELILAAAGTLETWPGYRFGLHDAPLETQVVPFRTDAVTGADGAATITVDLPRIEAAAQPLEATFVARVAEGSGRPVERRLTEVVAPDLPMIGIRPLFDGAAPEDGAARFALIALGQDLSPQALEVRWTVNRVERRFQWYQTDGNWRWEPVTRSTRVVTGQAILGDRPAEITVPVEWGGYELVVERLGAPYAAASVAFDAGWSGADTPDSPDILEVALDAAQYAVGDTARLRIEARESGTVTVAVLSDRVVAMQDLEVEAGATEVALPVTDAWGAGAYVAATLIRPMDEAQGRNPSRALGIVHAGVAPGDRALDVAVDVVGEAKPRQPMDVAVTVKGVAAGETAWVTLAAVDVGILNLTGFAAPDPQAYYFGQRRLGVELRDVYGRLIDGMTGAQGTVRTGGDAGGQMALEAPPPTEELVAFFTGPLQVAADGTATATFALPAFNGTVRLMAVAWSPRAVGRATGEVTVRDPVVVSASLPRFLASGDRSRLLLEFVHADGPTGAFGLELAADGATIDVAGLPQTVELDEGGRISFRVPISAGEPGMATIEVALTGPDGNRLERVLQLPVQHQDPEIARTSRFTLAPGETFTFDDAVFAGLRAGSGTATLSIGPLARLDAPGMLARLDRYPYGCTEQVTSRALPLLYVNDVATALGLGTEAELAERVDRAIRAILANQASNGAFGLWRPSSGDLWLDAYVTDFLARARARGHDVPEVAFGAALDNLRNAVNYAGDFEAGGEGIAYALFVLAREGAAAMGDLRYYVDERATAFTTPLGAAQLGAALAAYGDQLRADAMFRQAQAMLAGGAPPEDAAFWRADYGTWRRDVAAVLAIAVEAGTEALSRDALAARLAAAGGAVSTQEAVWQLMAANALVDDVREAGLLVDGAPPVGPLVHLRQDGSAPLSVANQGAAPTDLTLTTFGVPAEPEPAGGNGYAIERAYFTMEGEPFTPDEVAAGTRLVTVLTVRPLGYQEARLMVADPLPAGFEIDNPNLLRGGDVRAMEWLETAEGAVPEFRQDRFLAAIDWRADQPFRLAYVVRAVSPGTYRHAPASVEDMYRPLMRARSEAGQVTVAE